MLLQGYSNFEKNEAQDYGGAVHAAKCGISLMGVHLFSSNRASHGGALSLVSDSRIYLVSVRLVFINNLAVFGGAVYIQDTMSPTDCINNVKFLKSTSDSFLLRSECFFDAAAESFAITVVIDGNNYATEQGNFLFGGKLNRCIVNGMNGNEIFPRLLVNDNSLITGPSATALISSQPYRLCFCGNQHTKQAGGNRHNCAIEILHIKAARGELFIISVAALDQLDHAVFSTV